MIVVLIMIKALSDGRGLVVDYSSHPIRISYTNKLIYMCVYIYIYRERERERDFSLSISLYIYIYIHM